MSLEEFKYPIYIFLVIYTLLAYFAGLWIFNKTKIVILNPLLISIVAVVILLISTGIPYPMYKLATIPIDFLLGPTVVALGYALYVQREHLFKNFASIMISLLVGALVGILSVIGILSIFDSSDQIIASLIPKSVTNPIAIPIAEQMGGIGSITAIVVIMTGVFGGIIGPTVLRKFNITSKIAKGLALGSAAHGLGTAKAMEMGALEGAIAGLAIGLMGLFTAILVPIVAAFL